MSATENLENKIADVGFVESLKRYLRSRLHGLGWDIVRYRARPKWLGDNGRFEYQRQCHEFEIVPGSVVLDIGSGHLPFPLATITSDLYLENSPHRTDQLIRDHRPLLKLDIHCLPFADKSIDFLYCSHVLEHVADPLRACREVIRVSKRGYIETPNFGKDMLFGWADTIRHRWHVVSISNTLVFFEYSARQKKGLGSRAWQDLIFADHYHPIQEAFYKNQDIFNEMFSWENSFRTLVFRLDGSVETSDKP